MARAHRPSVLIAAAVVGAAVIGGGAWAASAHGTDGYRTAAASVQTVRETLEATGTVQPVTSATAAFQVAGTVADVAVTVGQRVTTGQVMASLESSSLDQSVSAAQSALTADQAKLSQDEAAQVAAATTTTTTTTASSPAPAPGGSGSVPGGGTGQDQQSLVADQQTADTDAKQASADLAAAGSACGGATAATPAPSSPPPTTTTTQPGGGSSAGSTTPACTSALAQALADQQKVQTDQKTVAHDETTLAGDLSTAAEASSSAQGNRSSASPAASTPGAGGAVPTAAQIDSDQAAVDTAQATLFVAEQARDNSQLTSPIDGTVASVGLATGDTVTAGSTTSTVVVVGEDAYEVTGTLTPSQVPEVHVGAAAAVTVDGSARALTGTVSNVGPDQVSSSADTYPFVVVLPPGGGLFSGATADVQIVTGQVTGATAVPTSALHMFGSRSYVLMLDHKGALVRRAVTVGTVGGDYTQIRSGIGVGDKVVLAVMSQPVPTSNTSGFGAGRFGAGGFGGGAGGARVFIGGPRAQFGG